MESSTTDYNYLQCSEVWCDMTHKGLDEGANRGLIFTHQTCE